jgi:hypothetical protein
MTRRSNQLRKAPSLSKPGGFWDALNQEFFTADSAMLESANIRQAVYSSVLRHRENHSSNCSNWLREVCGLKKISVVVAVVIVSSLDEETRAGGAYSMASIGRYEPWFFGCPTASNPAGNRLRSSVFITVVSPDVEALEVTAFSEITRRFRTTTLCPNSTPSTVAQGAQVGSIADLHGVAKSKPEEGGFHDDPPTSLKLAIRS